MKKDMRMEEHISFDRFLEKYKRIEQLNKELNIKMERLDKIIFLKDGEKLMKHFKMEPSRLV